MFPIISQVG
jgi:hypothetical protein